MRRMRLIAIVLSTLAAVLFLALAIGGLAENVRTGWGWPSSYDPFSADLVGGVVLLLALLAGVAGLWLGWARQKIIQSRAALLPKGIVPRSKYAVWATHSGPRAGRPAERSGLRTHKTLQRRG